VHLLGLDQAKTYHVPLLSSNYHPSTSPLFNSTYLHYYITSDITGIIFIIQLSKPSLSPENDWILAPQFSSCPSKELNELFHQAVMTTITKIQTLLLGCTACITQTQPIATDNACSEICLKGTQESLQKQMN